MSIGGHWRTIAPWARLALRPPTYSPSAFWQTRVLDPQRGAIALTGRWHAQPGSSEAVVVVHGLGGSAESAYLAPLIRAAEGAGICALRINVRGADHSGEDVAHAGLTADLHAAVAALGPEYRRIFVFGYSLGGHVTLRYASECTDPRVRAVAAICAPLDLSRSSAAIDAASRRVYLRYVLQALKASYEPVATRGRGVLALPEVRRICRIRQWDERIVAPRFGFRGASDYYEKMSAVHVLDALRVPALFVGARADPMVPEDTLSEALARPHALLEVRWVARAGHLSFPRDLEWGHRGGRGLEPQVLGWLRSQP